MALPARRYYEDAELSLLRSIRLTRSSGSDFVGPLMNLNGTTISARFNHVFVAAVSVVAVFVSVVTDAPRGF